MDLLDADGYMKKGKGKRAQIMQPDIWTMSTGVIMPGLSDFADCRCMSELPPAPPATMDQLRETTRSNAIAHVIYTSRTNRFPVNCPARRTHRHFVLKNKIFPTNVTKQTMLNFHTMGVEGELLY